MEKLIELLNEFKPAIKCANFKEHYEFIDDDIYLIRKGIDGEEERFPMYVCYKKGEFIKWLVDNDKIVLGDIALQVYNLDLSVRKHTYTEYPIYESLLMLLAIQDNPIEYLISVLR